MSSDGLCNQAIIHDDGYCIVSLDDVPSEADILQAQAENAMRGGETGVDDDLIQRLERLQRPGSESDFADSEDENPFEHQTEWATRIGPQGAHGFNPEYDCAPFDDDYSIMAPQLRNSLDIRPEKSGINPLVREAASLNLIGEGISTRLDTLEKPKRKDRPKGALHRQPVTQARPISDSDTSSDEEVVTSPFSTGPHSPIISCEEEGLTQSDEEAAAFLTEIGHRVPGCNVPLNIVKKAMKMHEVGSALNAFFMIGYEEGCRRNDLTGHFGEDLAQRFDEMMDFLEPRVCEGGQDGAKNAENTSSEHDRSGPDVIVEETLEIVSADERCMSASTEDGCDVFYDASSGVPQRNSSNALVTCADEQEIETEVIAETTLEGGTSSKQHDSGTKLDHLGPGMNETSSKQRGSSTKCTDNDDNTLTDGSKPSSSSGLDLSGNESKRSVRNVTTTDQGIQTSSSSDLSALISIRIVPTTEQAVQTSLDTEPQTSASTVTSNRIPSTSDQAAQTNIPEQTPCDLSDVCFKDGQLQTKCENVVESTQTSNHSLRGDSSEVDGAEKEKIEMLEYVVKKQRQMLKTLLEERNDLLEYIRLKEEQWRKIGQRQQREIQSLRTYTTQIMTDKVLSGRPLNRRASMTLIRAKQNHDKCLSLSFELKNKIVDLKLHITSLVRMLRELDLDRNAALAAIGYRKDTRVEKVHMPYRQLKLESDTYRWMQCDTAGYSPGSSQDPETSVYDAFQLGSNKVLPLERVFDEEDGYVRDIFDCLNILPYKKHVVDEDEESLQALVDRVEKISRQQEELDCYV